MLSMIALAPHPPIIIPEIGGSRLSEAEQTVRGMEELGKIIDQENPAALVLITPHGQVKRSGPTILTAPSLGGSFSQFGFPHLQLTFQTDLKLVELLEDLTVNTTPRPYFAARLESGPSLQRLDHGALVPLYYLQKAGLNPLGVHITFGYNSFKECYQFGKLLRKAIDRRGVKTVILASGDLSHRLRPDAPAGYSPRGVEYDHEVVRLIRTGQLAALTDFDPQWVEEAGECGLRSYLIAFGAIEGEAYRSQIISYEGPFGVGYLVAALQRHNPV